MLTVEILAVLLILISPAIGSFIAVVVDRLPRGEDVSVASSRCRSCKAKLGIVDLIPVVSFVLQKGRCRHCVAAIPGFTLYVELLALGAAILAVSAGGGLTDMFLAVLWLWLLLALAASDALWMRLPDPLTFSALALGLILAVRPYGPSLDQALWGAVLGVGSFAALRWGYMCVRGREGLGLGDVKLMAGLGAFAGPLALPHLIFIAALAGLAAAWLTRGETQDGLRGTRALPFGTALCFAAALIWFWRAVMQNQL